jgi:hypothetical protein
MDVECQIPACSFYKGASFIFFRRHLHFTLGHVPPQLYCRNLPERRWMGASITLIGLKRYVSGASATVVIIIIIITAHICCVCTLYIRRQRTGGDGNIGRGVDGEVTKIEWPSCFIPQLGRSCTIATAQHPDVWLPPAHLICFYLINSTFMCYGVKRWALDKLIL